MDVVDVWAQTPTERMAAAPWMESLVRWAGRPGDTRPTTVPQTLAAMDEAGVDVALLSAWYAPGGPLIDNDELLAQVDEAPGRFRALVGADLDRPMDAVRTIRDLGADDRVVGVRIVPWLWDAPPDDRRYYPVYVACVEAGLPFCTQIGHTGPLMSSATGRLIPHLERVMLDFPELVVVGGHVGFPWIDELLTMTVKFPNFHVDTSAYALDRLPPSFVEYLRGLGRDRVMFGTNWPMIQPARCLAGLDGLDLGVDARAAFLGGTARRVFSL